MSAFRLACVILSVIGLVIGLICGLFLPQWVMALVGLGSIALASWGVWQTYFVHNNRYEFVRWSWFSACVLLGEVAGYLLGMLRWWLAS